MGLESVLPPEAIVEPQGRYLADLMGQGRQGTADAVVLPSTTEEVAAVMRWCYEHDVPLTAARRRHRPRRRRDPGRRAAS